MADRELDRRVAEMMGISAKQVRARGSITTITCHTTNPACIDGAWSAAELIVHFSAEPYSSDIAADYSVLVRVRETWDRADEANKPGNETNYRVLHGSFHLALQRIWKEREDKNKSGEWTPWWSMYQPGDFSRAALASLPLTKGASNA